jgi:hypothetical protein
MNLTSSVTNVIFSAAHPSSGARYSSSATQAGRNKTILSGGSNITSPLHNYNDNSAPTKKTLMEQVFDRSVSLKVTTSHFAMHLSAPERARIFLEIDNILDVDRWEEGEKLPLIEGYKDFLRYLIRNSDSSWASLGSSDEGNFLVAWVQNAFQMTASFDGFKVFWTVKNVVNEKINLVSGVSKDLEFFAKQAKFYLETTR